MRRIGIVLACVIGSAAPAQAAKIATPPITMGGGSLIECSITNISGTAATVTLRVIDNDVQIKSLGPESLAGGASATTSDFCDGTCLVPRCVFNTSTPATNFRASACVADHTFTNTDKVCIPAQ